MPNGSRRRLPCLPCLVQRGMAGSAGGGVGGVRPRGGVPRPRRYTRTSHAPRRVHVSRQLEDGRRTRRSIVPDHPVRCHGMSRVCQLARRARPGVSRAARRGGTPRLDRLAHPRRVCAMLEKQLAVASAANRVCPGGLQRGHSSTLQHPLTETSIRRVCSLVIFGEPCSQPANGCSRQQLPSIKAMSTMAPAGRVLGGSTAFSTLRACNEVSAQWPRESRALLSALGAKLFEDDYACEIMPAPLMTHGVQPQLTAEFKRVMRTTSTSKPSSTYSTTCGSEPQQF